LSFSLAELLNGTPFLDLRLDDVPDSPSQLLADEEVASYFDEVNFIFLSYL